VFLLCCARLPPILAKVYLILQKNLSTTSMAPNQYGAVAADKESCSTIVNKSKDEVAEVIQSALLRVKAHVSNVCLLPNSVITQTLIRMTQSLAKSLTNWKYVGSTFTSLLTFTSAHWQSSGCHFIVQQFGSVSFFAFLFNNKL